MPGALQQAGTGHSALAMTALHGDRLVWDRGVGECAELDMAGVR